MNLFSKPQSGLMAAKFQRIMAVITLLFSASLFSMISITPAEAAECGGLNQKACPAFKKGPQCGTWLAKDKKKICRRCGGPGEKACPVLKKGKVCKPGLKKKKGKCVAKAKKKPCGGLNQKACPVLKKGEQCKTWLSKNKKKLCTPCGGFKQKACPVLKKGKVCQAGLKRKKGKCVFKGKKVKAGFLKQINQFTKGSQSQISALGDLNKCLAQSLDKGKFIKAFVKKDKNSAKKLVNSCLTKDLKRTLRAKPAGLSNIKGAPGGSSDDGYFNTLSIGVGVGAIAVIGGAGDIGVVISLNGDGVKFYRNGEFGFGAGASVGGDVVVELARQKLKTGTDKGRAVTASGKYLAGGGVAVGFDGHDWPKWKNFDGIAISGGVGAGAEVGTVYKSKSKIY